MRLIDNEDEIKARLGEAESLRDFAGRRGVFRIAKMLGKKLPGEAEDSEKSDEMCESPEKEGEDSGSVSIDIEGMSPDKVKELIEKLKSSLMG